MGSDVELDRVSYRRGRRGGIEDLSLRMSAGRLFGVLGPPGSGKSALLRLISGFALPARGHILLGGRDLRHLPPGRSRVVPLFRDLALFPVLDVGGNIGFGPAAHGMPERLRRRRVEEMAELVGLRARLDAPVETLPPTDALRVALARALAIRPQVLVLDEPLHTVPPPLRGPMLHLLQDLQRRSEVTFVYLTADPMQALEVSHRMGVLARGRLQQAGTPETLYERPDNAFVAAHVGENNGFPGRITSACLGQAVLETELGQLRGRNPRRMQAGDHAILFVRPEQLSLEGYAPNEVDSLVLRQIFDGASVTTMLRGLPGREIVLRSPNPGGVQPLPPGLRVQIRFEPQHAVVLPAGDLADA